MIFLVNKLTEKNPSLTYFTIQKEYILFWLVRILLARSNLLTPSTLTQPFTRIVQVSKGSISKGLHYHNLTVVILILAYTHD